MGEMGITLVTWEEENRKRKIKANFKKLYFGLQILSTLSSLIYNTYVAFMVQLALENLNLILYYLFKLLSFLFSPSDKEYRLFRGRHG